MQGISPPLSVQARRAWQSLVRRTSAVGRSRRTFLAASAVAIAIFALPFGPASAEQRTSWTMERWVATWGAAPAGPPLATAMQTFNNQTLRLIVHTSIGGSQARIRLSNERGTTPLRIGSAHIAVCQGGSSIAPGTDRTLTFGGQESVTIPPGALVLSDPVGLDVPALSDLAVSLYLPGEAPAATIHAYSLQTSFVSLPGDFTNSATLPLDHTIKSWPFLAEVDVNRPDAAAIVVLGDSITDGSVTVVDANHRLTDMLALRQQTTRDLLKGARGGHSALQGPNSHLGVVNRGISGNRLLRDPGEQPLFGKAALARFDSDVTATAGVRYMVVLLGINDIGHPGTGAIPLSESVTPQDLIAGYRQLIARAHDKGIAVFGGTLTPFEGTTFPGYYTPEKEAVREAANNWIRGSGEFDAVIDFDRAVRDPAHPSRLLPMYDSGDHLHPNDLGMQAMANAIPLELLHSQSPQQAPKRK
jgi:lysophospholipase L1-like esterase